MAKFLCLFRSKMAADARPASPEEMQRTVKAWMSWMEDLKRQGHLASPGERLNDTGKVVRGKMKAVTDGPYAEAKDTIGGYLLLEAGDWPRRRNWRKVVQSSKATGWSK